MNVNASENILIVDDQDDILHMMSEIISRWGYTPIVAHDGDDAIAKIVDLPVEVMITDLRMPNTDGMQLLEKVKEIHPDTVVIMFTGYPAVNTAVDAFKHGVFDYITKPVDFSELKKKIEEGLRTKNAVSVQKTLHGLNWAMLISIPFWLALGIYFANQWLK
jgi:DNA-binding NtrC family response regulator